MQLLDAGGGEGWAFAKGVLVVEDLEDFFDARHFIIKLIAFHLAGEKYRLAKVEKGGRFGRKGLG